MFFEAKLKGKLYQVDVIEGMGLWKIGLKEHGKEWSFYEIPKSDFQTAEKSISFLFKGRSYLIDVIKNNTNYDVYTGGTYRTIEIYNDEMILHESLKRPGGLGKERHLATAIPGKIIQILVQPGDEVKAKETLVLMEAMKMENEMRTEHDVKIKEIFVENGQNVEAGAVLMSFE